MKMVSLSVLGTGCFYPPGNIPGAHLFRGSVNPRVIVRPGGICQWKIPITPSRREHVTFRLVVECIN